jgi:ParB-like chromosome segregation protein Spo0J
MDAQLPPVLVDRRSMRVIDGMHRLLAASLQGRDTIEVKFFDGSSQDAFLHAVEANVTHGLPLSQADRRAATERIIESHPHLSDRAIAQLAGLSAKTVGGIRRRSATVPQVSARVGKDGKVRPLSGVEGRQRVAEFLAEHPQASLREAARGAGVSPGTVRDVRRRLECGEAPAPGRPEGEAPGRPEEAAQAQPARNHDERRALPAYSRAQRAVRHAPAFLLDKLLRDPSLRHNEQGRRLLRWLQHNPAGPQDRSSVIAVVPPHCAALVVQLARQNAQMWLEFAQELDERVRVLDPWAGEQANGTGLGRPRIAASNGLEPPVRRRN